MTAPPARTAAPASTSNGSTCVVIADSDAGRRGTLSKLVRQFDPGAVILEAASGEELTETILVRRPSLGFVSMQLDAFSGPEAVAMARKRGTALPCLVLVSSRVFPQWKELAQSLGAYEVLKTPLDTDHIAGLLRANARRLKPSSLLLATASDAGRSAICRVLVRSGFNVAVEETDSGRHALKLLRTGAYELAFLDANLPDLDGLELACQVQSLRLPTRLTLLTAGEPELIAQAGRYFGVESVLKMPFYARDIDLTLHHAFGLRRPYLLNALTAAPAPTALLRIADLPQQRGRAEDTPAPFRKGGLVDAWPT